MLRKVSCWALLLIACGDGGATTDRAVLTTVLDSTADSVFATTTGDVSNAGVRQVVAEMVIAPGIDDTTLFARVSEFDVDRSGRIWVFDRSSSSILVFGPGGELIRRVGRRGGGPGEFQQNGGMVILANDSLAQWDSNNARISVFDSAGVLAYQWPVPGGFGTSNGLFTDTSGALYLKRPVTAPREGEILGRIGLVRLSDGGRFGDSLAPPDLPVPREPYVASSDEATQSMGSSFSAAYHWGWTPEGEFIAADGSNYSVVLARRATKPLVIRRTMQPVAVTSEERQLEQDIITAVLRQVDPSWSFRGRPPLPDTKAPVLGVWASRDGRIWVQVSVPSEPIPETQLGVPRDSTIPVQRFRTPPVYEVYDRNGRFLAQVRLPSRATLIEADGDLVWGIELDDDDLPRVIRWHIEPGI